MHFDVNMWGTGNRAQVWKLRRPTGRQWREHARGTQFQGQSSLLINPASILVPQTVQPKADRHFWSQNGWRDDSQSNSPSVSAEFRPQ
jgi:hypothetical protein